LSALLQAIQFLYSNDVEGTVIARNSFTHSNQRCIVIEGTSNATISHNTAYETFGHCMYIGFESFDNLMASNLVSITNNIRNSQLSGEDDYLACAFRNQYSPNNYLSNIAVAGQR